MQLEGLFSLDVSQSGGGGALLAACGELDVSTAPQLREVLVQLFQSGCQDIALDAAELSFIDSTGLGVLVSAHRRAVDSGGQLRILNASSRITRTLEITGVLELLTGEEVPGR